VKHFDSHFYHEQQQQQEIYFYYDLLDDERKVIYLYQLLGYDYGSFVAGVLYLPRLAHNNHRHRQ
jgi:hypothetical protein